MKTHPILFSTLMVQAILEDRKTQTRRIAVPIKQKEDKLFFDQKVEIGDIFWVRETWAEFQGIEPIVQYVYKADKLYDTPAKEHLVGNKWKPSIFMPKKAARIFLEVENIIVEKLQQISEEDAAKEGIELVNHNCFRNYIIEHDWIYNGSEQKHYHMLQDPIGSFASLWISIYGLQSWEDNPFVFAYTFKQVSKPENFTI